MSQIKVTYLGHMGSDITVVNAARVSFGKRSGMICVDHQLGKYELEEADAKLITYLAKHKHKSPFNHVSLTFHVKAPIFVARQLQKHEYMPWNEISRRYVDDEPEFYTPVWRGRSKDKKQGSEGPIEIKSNPTNDYALQTYKNLLADGVAPEQARVVLPQSLMTEWYWSGFLYAWAKMCSLRCKPDSQEETRQVADQIDEKIRNWFPYSWEALRTYEE